MKFSIILPCYNVTSYLSACLDSLCANDLSDSEIILVNDGSKDDFAGWCRNYFACDLEEDSVVHRINWKNSVVKIIMQPNMGVSTARNTGLDHATGEYILFVDPDDTVTEDYLATIEQELSGENCDLLLFGYWEKQEGAQPVAVLPKREYRISTTEEAVSELLPNFLGDSLESIDHWLKSGVFNPYREYGAVWRCVYRRILIHENNIRFKKNMQLNEDQFFNCEYISCIQSGKACMKCLYNYILRPGGAMRKHWGKTLLASRQALLEEKEQFCRCLGSRGYGQISYLWYAGTNVFTVFEILRRGDLAYWTEIKRYIQHPTVQRSIKEAPDLFGKAGLLCDDSAAEVEIVFDSAFDI